MDVFQVRVVRPRMRLEKLAESVPWESEEFLQ